MEVWRQFDQSWINEFGSPVIIITDNGPEFLANFKKQVQARGIEHRYITPHSPQLNDQVEKYNGMMKSAIRRLVVENPYTEWTSLISYAQFAIRILKSRSTSYSSFQIVYGMIPNLLGHLEFAKGNYNLEEISEELIMQHVEELKLFKLEMEVEVNLKFMEDEIENYMYKIDPIKNV